MMDNLLPYYERELHLIRREAGEFAKQFPGVAGRLLLEPNQSSDPHVERLIESFALITARIQKKLDDDFPELTDALLNILYPHYLSPIPSFSIVQLNPDCRNPQVDGIHIPRGAALNTQKVEGLACQFRTCYNTEVWPIEVLSAKVEAPPFGDSLGDIQPPQGTGSMLRIKLGTQGDLRWSQLNLDHLRLHLTGESRLVATLYELLANDATDVWYRGGGSGYESKFVHQPASKAVIPVGFEENEGLLPYAATSQPGYRLLTELFTFHEKFFFVDLVGLREMTAQAIGRELEVYIFFNSDDETLRRQVNASTFKLGCSPVVNLFEKMCEPIQLSHRKNSYPVKPDVRHPLAMEIYSIDRVISAQPGSEREYRPFYSLTHESSWNQSKDRDAYWYGRRSASAQHGDAGTDVSLNLVDLEFSPHVPAEAAVTVVATCSNRDLPSQLPLLGEPVRFRMQAAMPLGEIKCLKQPTSPLRALPGRASYWRLVSHLSLNHLSLEGDAATGTLQELLRLYDFSDQHSGQQRAILNRQMVDSIVSLGSKSVVARVGSALQGGICRGVGVNLELDEEPLLGVGAYLFGSVLERLFALHTHVNSFTKLSLSTHQRGNIKTWAPRSGDHQLL
jgi:type VI secretion system protein ImpG